MGEIVCAKHTHVGGQDRALCGKIDRWGYAGCHMFHQDVTFFTVLHQDVTFFAVLHQDVTYFTRMS